MINLTGFHTVTIPLLLFYNGTTTPHDLHLRDFLNISSSDLERRLILMDRCFDFIFPFLGPDLAVQVTCARLVEDRIKDLIVNIVDSDGNPPTTLESPDSPKSDHGSEISRGVNPGEIPMEHSNPKEQSGISDDTGGFSDDSYCTVVTGYWPVSTSKYSPHQYEGWFNTTLSVNMPYVIFYDSESLSMLKSYRADLPSRFIEKNFSSFSSHRTYSSSWYHEYHMPSYQLGIIWLEKLHLLYEVSKTVSSEYLVWLDAGNAFYRGNVIKETSLI